MTFNDAQHRCILVKMKS